MLDILSIFSHVEHILYLEILFHYLSLTSGFYVST